MGDRVLCDLLLECRELFRLECGMAVVKDHYQHVCRIDDHDHGVGDVKFSLDVRLKLQLKFGERVATEGERAEGRESVFLHRLRPEIHLPSCSAQMHADDHQLKRPRYHRGAWSPCARFSLSLSARASTPRGMAASTRCMPIPCAKRCMSRASSASSLPFPPSRSSPGTTAKRLKHCCAWALPVCAAPWTAPSPMAGDGCAISWDIPPRRLPLASWRD